MPNSDLFMPFPKPIIMATFLNRPQRFLAEMKLADGSHIIAYCANSGSFSGCLEPGSPAILWDSGDTKRKLRYTLRAIEINGVWIGTDTHLANHIVGEIIQQQLIPGFENFEKLDREWLVEKGHRVDFLLSGQDELCLIEVKSASVVKNKVARFPDSITPRSLKQLKSLINKAEDGYRIVLLYLIQRSDAESFTVNEAIYPAYTTALKTASAVGVESIALSVSVTPQGIGNPRLLPVNIK